jgi:hypothetical protein
MTATPAPDHSAAVTQTVEFCTFAHATVIGQKASPNGG